MARPVEEARAASAAYYQKNRDQILAKRAARRSADPDAARDAGRKWFAANPDKARGYARKSALKNRYGLTPEQYEEMVADQGGRCAICKTDTPDKKLGTWIVDHDHETGKVRALLCRQCNTGLGQFRDNTGFLAEAIKYIERHSNAATAAYRPIPRVGEQDRPDS